MTVKAFISLVIILFSVACGRQEPEFPVYDQWPKIDFCVNWYAVDKHPEIVQLIEEAIVSWGAEASVTTDGYTDDCVRVFLIEDYKWASDHVAGQTSISTVTGLPTRVVFRESLWEQTKHFSVIHEIGHALGAEHNEQMRSIMRKNISRGGWYELLDWDVEQAALRRAGYLKPLGNM